VNLARTFKTIQERGAGLHVRRPDTAAAAQLIAAAVAEQSPLDPITKSQSLHKLAIAQANVDDREGASKSLEVAASFMPERRKQAVARV